MVGESKSDGFEIFGARFRNLESLFGVVMRKLKQLFRAELKEQSGNWFEDKQCSPTFVDFYNGTNSKAYAQYLKNFNDIN